MRMGIAPSHLRGDAHSQTERGVRDGSLITEGRRGRAMNSLGRASLLDATLEPTSSSNTGRRQVGSRRDGDLLRPGEVLAEAYEIRSKLGEGGMGQVYEAYDRLLDRCVAIKVAFPGMSVAREARALAALRGHPSMVTVHALGVHHGMEYAVMDRIHGGTLREHLDRRAAAGLALSISEIVDIGASMADGLAVVHEAGMAHRDVKPANVILAPGDRVVITDFGIFRPECDRTPAALVWGTPEYMAPEAARDTVVPGELFLVDVYALGIVLFEMLTGAVPFQGEPATRVFLMHILGPVPDPAVRRPGTPRDLATLVRGMLAKSPKARLQGMREIAWQLRHLRGPKPIVARDRT